MNPRQSLARMLWWNLEARRTTLLERHTFDDRGEVGRAETNNTNVSQISEDLIMAVKLARMFERYWSEVKMEKIVK